MDPIDDTQHHNFSERIFIVVHPGTITNGFIKTPQPLSNFRPCSFKLLLIDAAIGNFQPAARWSGTGVAARMILFVVVIELIDHALQIGVISHRRRR